MIHSNLMLQLILFGSRLRCRIFRLRESSINLGTSRDRELANLFGQERLLNGNMTYWRNGSQKDTLLIINGVLM
jgi:hypothetical protein